MNRRKDDASGKCPNCAFVGLAAGAGRCLNCDYQLQWDILDWSNPVAAYDDGKVRASQTFTCRDIGYGVETGEVFMPANGPADAWGKRAYQSVPTGNTVYLFDDELDERPKGVRHSWDDEHGVCR